jgi:hypothetical protein
MVRAPVCGTGGRWFEATQLYHRLLNVSRAISSENRMTLADMVYEQVKALPEPLAREVLDFVAFLHERSERPGGVT